MGQAPGSGLGLRFGDCSLLPFLGSRVRVRAAIFGVILRSWAATDRNSVMFCLCLQSTYLEREALHVLPDCKEDDI